MKPRSGSNCENAEKSRAWGHGGCEPRIEVIVKMQKKVRGRGVRRWGRSGGIGAAWM